MEGKNIHELAKHSKCLSLMQCLQRHYMNLLHLKSLLGERGQREINLSANPFLSHLILAKDCPEGNWLPPFPYCVNWFFQGISVKARSFMV